jgi:hypothetical protein
MDSEGYSGHDLESRHSNAGDAIALAFCAGSKEGIHKTTMFKQYIERVGRQPYRG